MRTFGTPNPHGHYLSGIHTSIRNPYIRSLSDIRISETLNPNITQFIEHAHFQNYLTHMNTESKHNTVYRTCTFSELCNPNYDHSSSDIDTFRNTLSIWTTTYVFQEHSIPISFGYAHFIYAEHSLSDIHIIWTLKQYGTC